MYPKLFRQLPLSKRVGSTLLSKSLSLFSTRCLFLSSALRQSWSCTYVKAPHFIITFYSFKGGVGRSMALANIAVLLAQRGLRVLAVDWDLEAPGLDRYFRSQFEIASHNDNAGLIDLLVDASDATSEQRPDWRDYVSSIDVAGKYPLSLITSGRPDGKYDAKVLDFDWRKFFEHADGGEFIEELREKWREEFNVVLIDSRTGITDSGGVCTIQLPDILALVFTTNEQSVDGVIKVASRAQAARQTLAYDRMPLLVFPLLSRFDGRTEFQEAQKWLDRLDDTLKPFYNDWVPKSIQARRVLERTKLPYIAFFSFGENLPAVTEGTSDPEGLGYAYLSAASLIAGDFQSVDRLIRFGPEFEAETSVVPEPTDAETKVSGVRAAPIAADWPEQPPSLLWPMAGHSEVRATFERLLTRAVPWRFLPLRGPSESGKSHITRQMLNNALRIPGLACGRFDFKGLIDADAEVRAFVQFLDVPLGLVSPRLHERLGDIMNALRQRAQPALLVFDTYESAGEAQEWVEKQLLPSLIRATWLRIVIAGQRVPERVGTVWESVAFPPITLKPPQPTDWFEYGKRNRPELTLADVETICRLASDSASILAQLLSPVS